MSDAIAVLNAGSSSLKFSLYTGAGAVTDSIVMRSKSGTVRRIEAEHALDKLMLYSNVAYR